MRPRAYYPMFADLNGRSCLVVGGGMVAQRKVTALLRHGARVTVVSPRLTARLAASARRGRIRHLARRFRPADARGAWLVYAATDDLMINRTVYRSAQRRRLFANVVDQKPLCSFIAPAVFQRGPLTIAISTGGASPSIAKRLRRELARLIGAEYVPMLSLLAGLRGIAKRILPDYRDRKRYFEALVNGRVFAQVRAGRRRQARREALRLLNAQARRRAR